LSKSNSGSNVHGGNDTRTARAGGMQDINIPEPKVTEDYMLKCPICGSLFSSREDYMSHVMARHQPPSMENEMSPATT
jgi:hypothetical protein